MKRTKIGFTGTREGMSNSQKQSAERIIAGEYPVELHHGDCIGADTDMHHIAKKQAAEIHLHPCNLHRFRAYLIGDRPPLPPKEPLARNRDIVDTTDILIAAPFSMEEVQRSGTWATVRYARKQGKTIYIVWPDGSIKVETTAP